MYGEGDNFYETMDPKELKKLENQCVQEHVAACRAACPFHVDARQFVAHIQKGEWQKARNTLDKSLPFSDILGRICDQVCTSACKRGEVGDPIAVGDLELQCVMMTSSGTRPVCAPSKSLCIAVIGGDLSCMIAAYDLVRKGYTIEMVVQEDRLAAEIKDLPVDMMPSSVIDLETQMLLSLGVRILFKAGTESVETAIDQADAVFIGRHSPEMDFPGIGRDASDRIVVDPLTLRTSVLKVFAGDFSRKQNTRYIILDAVQGRWAAVSIDRFLKNVSLTAAREQERPYKTLLYTPVDGVIPLSKVRPSDPVLGYTADEAKHEADRCLQCECMVCVKSCLYMEQFGGYPKTYTRDMYNSEKVIWGKHPANLLVNSCSMCRLCEEVCPEGFSMADLCLNQRRGMNERGKMPPSAHEFAIDDMLSANSGPVSLVRGHSGMEPSAYLFFSGCQMAGLMPEQLLKVYAYLRLTLDGGVGIALQCCGAPAHWAGRTELMEKNIKDIAGLWETLGRPEVITGCTTCHTVFSEFLPGVKTRTLWEILEQTGLPESGITINRSSALAIHDPCTSRYLEPARQSVRAILHKMDVPTEELTFGREYTRCCGFGGLMANANPELAKEVIDQRAAEHSLDYVTYCAVCRDMLATGGKRAVHLLDLIFGSTGEPDPYAKKAIGHSQRRNNREYTKNLLLQNIFNEAPERDSMVGKGIKLIISPDVREKMENRRILDDDVREVISQCRENRNFFLHKETGYYLGFHTPVNVTFWVEYSETDSGIRIHNAYCHRMKIGKVVIP